MYFYTKIIVTEVIIFNTVSFESIVPQNKLNPEENLSIIFNI